MELWDQPLPKAKNYLNMFHIVLEDPSKSAYEILHEKHNSIINHVHYLDAR